MKAKFSILLLALATFFLPLANAQTAPPTTHYVALTWTYTQGTDLATGFYVYRIVSGSTGSWTQLNTTAIPVATLTYSDDAVSSGVVYEYYITAVDASGIQSNPSPTVTASAIPGPFVPGAPTATVH